MAEIRQRGGEAEQEHSTCNDRRAFLKEAGARTWASAVGTSAVGASIVGSADVKAQPPRRPAGQRVVVGIIGTGGMGLQHVRTLAGRDDVEIAYVCDVDSDRSADAARQSAAAGGATPQTVGDLRRVLDDPRVDAVWIATPDHWHAPAAILALDAGKHVYVEKPCCHNIREGELLAEAVEKSGLVLQVGTQSRSTDCVREAMQRLSEGEIGEILVAKAWNSQRRGSIGKRKPSDPPPKLDFEAWLGPAPEVPYQANLLHAVWRWWYAFGCGDIGNDGVHDIDVALWGLNPQRHPTRASCFGSKSFFDDDQQFPDTQYAVLEYPQEKSAEPSKQRIRQLIFEQRIWSPYSQEGYSNGAAFYGTEGMMIIGHTEGWKLYGPGNQLLAERTGKADLRAHHSDFLECIRGNRKRPTADIRVGHQAATIVHLANIAARVGRVLEFDAERGEIRADTESTQLLGRTYRTGHWAVPVGT